MKKPILIFSLLISITAFAKVKTETVQYKDGDTTLEGMISYDTDKVKTKLPGVVVVHDWMGVGENVIMRAEQLAEMGYVAFVADIYGKGIRPKNPKEAAEQATKYKSGDRSAMRSRAKAAYEELKKNKFVDSDKISATGYCFGGTAALEMARMGLPLKGVVSFHGGLSSVNPNDANNIKAKILVLHGAIDPNVPPAEVEKFKKELIDAKKEYQIVSYPGAVHAFTVKSAGNDISKGAAYNESADKKSFIAAKEFLEKVNK